LFPDYWFAEYKVVFFLFDSKTAATQMASWALTHCFSAEVAVCEGSPELSGTYFVGS
jgi:hypothetical protein